MAEFGLAARLPAQELDATARPGRAAVFQAGGYLTTNQVDWCIVRVPDGRIEVGTFDLDLKSHDVSDSIGRAVYAPHTKAQPTQRIPMVQLEHPANILAAPSSVEMPGLK